MPSNKAISIAFDGGTSDFSVDTPLIVADAIFNVEFSGQGSMVVSTIGFVFERALYPDFTLLVDDRLNINPADLEITRFKIWYHPNWYYRRKYTLPSNPESMTLGHPLECRIPVDLIRQGKIRTDAADIEVVHLISFIPELWQPLLSKVEFDNLDIVVKFDIPETIDPFEVYDRLFIYYGNKDLVAKSEFGIEYIEDEWPVQVPYSSERITYTRPGEHWVDGTTSSTNASAAFDFWGDKVRILADKGPDKAIMLVSLDAGEWELVDLFSGSEKPQEPVYTQTGLTTNEEHTLRIRHSGEAHPSSQGEEIKLDSIEFRKPHAMDAALEEADSRLLWESVIGGVVDQ